MSKTTLTEVFFAGEQKDSENGVWAEILREGEFAKTPVGNGILDRPFKVTRSGTSNADPQNLVVSMEELVENFNDKAFEYVTIPLSHDDLLLENTGYIDELKIEEDSEGVAKLWARHRFTEPEVEEKIKRGSIPSRSAGIIFDFLRKSDGKKFNAALKHVTPTDTPWINGLNPYGVFASDEIEPEEMISVSGNVEAVKEPEVITPEIDAKPIPVEPKFDAKEWMANLVKSAKESLNVQFNLNEDYEVMGVGLDNVVVRNNKAETSWTVPYRLEEDDVILAPTNDWCVVSGGSNKPSVATAQMSDKVTPLQEAQQLRELRLSQQNGSKLGGISQMTEIDTRLEGLELSDEARGLIESLQAENESLQDEKRKARIGERMAELDQMGLDKHPGFLRKVREIYASDDGGAALVLNLSDESGNPTGEKVKQTATEIVDSLIAALPKDKDQKILLSDQHLLTDGQHVAPPEGDEGMSHEDKVKAARETLFPEINRRKSGGDK